MRRLVTKKDIEKMEQLYLKPMSLREVAKELGWGSSTICRCLKSRGITRPLKVALGMRKTWTRPPHSKETRQKMREAKLKNPTRYWLGKKLPPKMKKKALMALEKAWERAHTPSANKKRSESLKRCWKDKNYRENIFKKWSIKPSIPEKKLTKILQRQFPNEWKYVGDYDVWIGERNPDFINVNGQKKVIEIFGEIFHNPDKAVFGEIPYQKTVEGTIEHYKKYGFDTLIIWDYELKNPKQVIEKIRRFDTM